MAQTKTIQLLRSSAVYASLEAAKSGIQTAAGTRQDGELLLGRYWSGTGANAVIKSVIGIYHKSPDLTAGQDDPTSITAGWTFIQDITSSSEGLQQLQDEVDAIETALGIDGDGTWDGYPSGSDIVGEQTTITGTVNEIIEYIKTLDLAQTGGNSGDVITTVSQADGQVSATASSLTDVLMTGYSKTNDTGAIAATDSVEKAFSKLENAIGQNKVASADGSVTVTQPTTGSSAGKTDLAVNVDGTTLVKSQSTGTISSALKVLKVIPSGTAGTDEVVDSNLATNVKEAYRLVYDGSTTAIGQQINVYKDSSLKEVYLGADTDTINATTGVITKNTVTDPQSMNFAYQLADGTYSLVKIDVSKFLTESEFGNGLQVSGGVVSVNVDSTSGKVRTAATPSGATPGSADDTGLVDVLTVSSNGVKVDNIQTAIDYAVQNATGDLAVTAQGDNYITAAQDATDNKKINVSADVQDLTATAGTPGVYNSTTGAQTTAPVAGTLSGVANSLGDAADIATKVKTYVDGAIAIEAARSDAKNLADLKTVKESLDGAATATAADSTTGDFSVLTKVNEVDGVVQSVGSGANDSKEVLLKKLASTGAAEDVTIADSGSLITATNVEGALQEIVGSLNAAKVVANDVITVDTSNNTTKLAVTIGNGLEKSSNALQVKDGNGITVDSNGVSVNAGNGLTISSDAVTVVVDTTTAGHSDMLSVTSNGILLSNTWDCGTF